MSRSLLAAIVSVVLCSEAQAATLSDPQVNVAVYNDARVPESVVKRAQEIASAVYAKAGITLVWRDGRTCSQSNMNSPWSIRIVSRSLNLRSEDFGVAFLGNDGRGMQADVFYSGIEGLRQISSARDAEILGHVMAHELGHLLLGLESHSRSGIMQARWTDVQLHQMSMGLLAFDSTQAESMRARLPGSCEVLRTQTQTPSSAIRTTADAKARFDCHAQRSH